MAESLFDDVTEEEDAILARLYELPRWPQDRMKDVALIRTLRRQFPLVDMYDEAGKFVVYWLAASDKVRKGVRWHARLRNWTSNADEYRRTGGRGRGGGAARGAVRAHAVARPGERESSDRLERW